MRKFGILLLGAMFSALSCVNVAPSEVEGDGNETGGNGTPDTPQVNGCYVLTSIVEQSSDREDSGAYSLFADPVYVSADWSDNLVLESFSYFDGEDNYECRLVYALPSYVYLYMNSDCIKMSLNDKGFVEKFRLDKTDSYELEYDSKGRLVKQIDTYKDGADEASLTVIEMTYTYDKNSALIGIDVDGDPVKIEYSSIPSKTAPLQYWANSEVIPWFEMPLLEAGLLGAAAVPQYLIKRISMTSEGESDEVVYSYKMNANGFVKEMKATWSSSYSTTPSQTTDTFTWRKYQPEVGD